MSSSFKKLLLFVLNTLKPLYLTSRLRKWVSFLVDPIMVGVGGGSPCWLLSCVGGAAGVGWMVFFLFRTTNTIARIVKVTAGPRVMIVWKAE